MLFPALKDIPVCFHGKFSKLKKDTNVQEGLGGALQKLKLSDKENLYHCLMMVAKFVKLHDRQHGYGQCGIPHRYPTKATKEEKRKGKERKKDYTAPDSTL